jgi:hypothetical protein
MPSAAIAGSQDAKLTGVSFAFWFDGYFHSATVRDSMRCRLGIECQDTF